MAMPSSYNLLKNMTSLIAKEFKSNKKKTNAEEMNHDSKSLNEHMRKMGINSLT